MINTRQVTQVCIHVFNTVTLQIQGTPTIRIFHPKTIPDRLDSAFYGFNLPVKNYKEYFLDTILPPFNLDVVTGKGMDLINLVSQLEIIQNISDILVKVPNQTKEHLSEFFKSCPFTANHAALIFEPERKGSFLT